MLTRHCAPIIQFKLCFADFFVFGPPLLLAQGASVRQYYWQIVRKMIVFNAPRLFSYQSPINWALHTGKGNTLQKRQRLHKKINRHRSPRSTTAFKHLQLLDPPRFSLVTTFNPWYRWYWCEQFLWERQMPACWCEVRGLEAWGTLYTLAQVSV